MRIVVSGVISLSPFAPGLVWDWVHFALGFKQMGHDVYFVEEVEPKWCVDAEGRPCPFEQSINRRFFRASMERFGLMDRACQLYNRGQAAFGLSLGALETIAKSADLLVNISGHAKSDLLLGAVKCRAYVDQDPVYTQLWFAEYHKDLNFKAHDVFFTVGLSVGTRYSPIPDGGVEWHGLLPPVVLGCWPFEIDPRCQRFTTIASWSGYGDLQYGDQWYRAKCEEFKRFARLPAEVDQELEVAMRHNIRDEPEIQMLRDGGWIVTTPEGIDSPDAYRRYILCSRAEIGIAKNAYVKGRSGWFSDRSSHYLACGKPVLAQSTGFEHWLPTGRGLLAFSTTEEAVDGIRRINGDYEAHCRAARAFAHEHLSHERVLPRMLDLCGSSE